MPCNLTVKEVAERFRKSVVTIRRWVREGFIQRTIRVKDGILIPLSEVERIERENERIFS